MKADRKELRNTGIFFSILIVLVAFILFRRGILFKKLFSFDLLITIILLLAVNVFPRFLVPLFRLASKGAKKLGSFLFKLITGIVFFLILTPIAFFMRLSGKKFLDTQREPQAESYYKNWERASDISKQF